jgi:hypothetical protein
MASILLDACAAAHGLPARKDVRKIVLGFECREHARRRKGVRWRLYET